MPGITKHGNAGAAAMQWSYRSSLGYLTGAANLTAANVGVSSSMARHLGLVNVPFALPAPTVLNVGGDDGTTDIWQFDPDERPSFQIDVSIFDGAFYLATIGMAGVTDGDMQIFPVPFNGVLPASMTLMFSRKAKSHNVGQKGAKGYEHLILLNCEVTPQHSAWQTKANAPEKYTITCNNADVLPDGRTVASVFTDAPNGELGALRVTSDYFLSYSTFVGDGETGKTITTANKPISTAKSKATVQTTDFAADTVTAIVTDSPYGVTITTDPGEGKFAHTRYEFLNFA